MNLNSHATTRVHRGYNLAGLNAHIAAKLISFHPNLFTNTPHPPKKKSELCEHEHRVDTLQLIWIK